MTDERTHGNGYNLSTGRSWQYADEAGDLAPLPVNWDDDEMTWDDDDTALDYEAKLQAAERTIAEMREERDIVSSMTVVVYVLVAVMFGALGYLARMMQGWIW